MTTPTVTANLDLHEHICSLLLAAKSQVRQTVNTAMVQTYWHIGRLINQFYTQFPFHSTVWIELSWPYFKTLLRVENKTARVWYANESADQGWSVRALDRQIATLFYERLLGSQDKACDT